MLMGLRMERLLENLERERKAFVKTGVVVVIKISLKGKGVVGWVSRRLL